MAARSHSCNIPCTETATSREDVSRGCLQGGICPSSLQGVHRAIEDGYKADINQHVCCPHSLFLHHAFGGRLNSNRIKVPNDSL